MKTRMTKTARPTDIPADWPIYNAPRPLYGDRDWQAGFLHGVFYAAIDPAGPYAEERTRRNHGLDAVLVEYITDEEWQARVDAYGQSMAEEYGIDLDDFTREDVESSYQNYLAQQAREEG